MTSNRLFTLTTQMSEDGTLTETTVLEGPSRARRIQSRGTREGV